MRDLIEGGVSLDVSKLDLRLLELLSGREGRRALVPLGVIFEYGIVDLRPPELLVGLTGIGRLDLRPLGVTLEYSSVDLGPSGPPLAGHGMLDLRPPGVLSRRPGTRRGADGALLGVLIVVRLWTKVGRGGTSCVSSAGKTDLRLKVLVSRLEPGFGI